jgi:hypothetical protein
MHRFHGLNKDVFGVVRSRHGVSRQTVGLGNCIRTVVIIHLSGSDGEFLFDDEYVFHQKLSGIEDPQHGFRNCCLITISTTLFFDHEFGYSKTNLTAEIKCRAPNICDTNK